MNTQNEDHLGTDEFAPIDLGSVSEETRGQIGESNEFNLGSPVSRD
ncbi:hypothetical protein [Hyphomonas sp.]|nr:hypothetical protein [Hyphomonas sp.]MBU3922550.1 hypothetical protein [Alphaproteobacteria bacterium]MBU4062334.1 hypothetical protein [Alphaproteobacteria bacterium]MBU4162716.1 hypothetical protein [Alphaproteobacteria bacterium]